VKYKYKTTYGATDTSGRYTKRPVVEIEISRAGQSRKFLALIDSGADQITMPAAIAEVSGSIEPRAVRTRSWVSAWSELRALSVHWIFE
jgi:hypothetical protein